MPSSGPRRPTITALRAFREDDQRRRSYEAAQRELAEHGQAKRAAKPSTVARKPR